jgi:hypothetical protein
LLTDRVGVVRSRAGLLAAVDEPERMGGGHRRSDHPAPVEAWRVRQTPTRAAGGEREAGLLPVALPAEARR